MEQWRKDARKEPIIIDIDSLVPADHLLRKIEKVMDYEWLYERLDPYYCHNNGRPGTDPVVLIKMVLIQHLFGIPSLRQTHREIQVNLAYRWFLGYGLLDDIPHFATVSHAFCKRFPEELTTEIFEHILNKALNNRMVDPGTIFIDGTHIKASANKKKYQKEQVKKAAKIYSGQLRREVNAEREKLGKKPIEDDEDDNDPQNPTGGETVEKTVSTTDPDSGMFVKGEHERQFAYEAHTACDRRGFVLGVEVTAGNVHDSVAWDAVYDQVTKKHEVQFVTMDAGYKTPWIAKKTLDNGKVPILPYTRYKGDKERYKPWEYTYDPVTDEYICPQGGRLRHTTTDKEGKRTYRSTPKDCKNCPCKAKCGANEKGQKMLSTHIWQEYLDIVEQLRKTDRAKQIYAQRKETIERVFADAKEKHAMRYTHHRGLAAVTRWVRLKYAAMNLKKLANWSWNNSFFTQILLVLVPNYERTPVFVVENRGSLTDCMGLSDILTAPLFLRSLRLLGYSTKK
jgi:transposase